ncbi:MAG: ribonuclease HIII [Candidatus Altiarchaeota archaeon]
MAEGRIGTDEAGKGDYFGYLVVAGVYADAEIEKTLKHYGVKDSKMLSDRRVNEIAKLVRRTCQHDIVRISPKKYNQLYDKLGNMNLILAWAHARAIENLLPKVKCDTVISDQFGDRKFLEEKLMEEGRKVRLIQKFRAESDTAVAAASILARDYYLSSLKRLSQRYGIELPKGSTHVMEAGRELVKKHGQEVLDEIAKKHFKTTSTILRS